jgi:hypothetical protein
MHTVRSTPDKFGALNSELIEMAKVVRDRRSGSKGWEEIHRQLGFYSCASVARELEARRKLAESSR